MDSTSKLNTYTNNMIKLDYKDNGYSTILWVQKKLDYI